MPWMTDPINSLIQFQEAYAAGSIPTQPGRLDPGILFAPDQPDGRPRFNYMRAQGSTLTAPVERSRGRIPVFNIGYAVPDAHRGKGLAKSTLLAALAEISSGLAGAGVRAIPVEAAISPGNLASLAVAQAIFDTEPTAIVDSGSGEAALH